MSKPTRELVERTRRAAELISEVNDFFSLNAEDSWSPRELYDQADTWERVLDVEDELLLRVRDVVQRYFDAPLTAALVTALAEEFEIRPKEVV